MGLFNKSSSATVELREEEFTEAASLRIDEDAGVIHGVKILGRKSKRGREYSDKAIQEAAGLYEGMEVNLNHPAEGNQSVVRAIQDGWGQLRNVKVGSDGAFGDLHYLKEHDQTPVIIERVKRGMRIGLSHNARGNSVNRGGKVIVESVPVVFSVDLVSRPATNTTLFESEDETATVAEILEANAESKSPLVPLLEAFVADTSYGKAPVAMTPQMQQGQPQEQQNTQLLGALKAAINALIDDGSMTLEEIIDRLKEKVGSKGKEAPPNKEGENDEDDSMFDDPEKKKKFEESVGAIVTDALKPLTESIGAVGKELEVRKLLESYNTSPTVIGADKFKALMEAEDEAAMKTLIEAYPPALRGWKRPAAQGGSGGASDRKAPRLINARRY